MVCSYMPNFDLIGAAKKRQISPHFQIKRSVSFCYGEKMLNACAQLHVPHPMPSKRIYLYGLMAIPLAPTLLFQRVTGTFP